VSEIEIVVGDFWQTKKPKIDCEVTSIEDIDGITWITSYSAIDRETDSDTKADFLRDYVFLRAGEPLPVVTDDTFNDDTFNDDTFDDDTPAQTFGDITPLHFNKRYMTSVPNVWRNAGKMRLIGIAGPARAGKDTLCSYMLDNLGGIWLRSSFADPLKEMLRAIGVDCSDDAKAVVSDDYGVTPRHMMQTLGTEWGRNLIDGDIWVKAFARLNAGKCVIVPDVRFENEADLVREHGVLIHLTGRGGIEGNHVSENAIEFKAGDIVIDNSRDLAWLHGQVDGNAVLAGLQTT
jgi:hypothetical protein